MKEINNKTIFIWNIIRPIEKTDDGSKSTIFTANEQPSGIAKKHILHTPSMLTPSSRQTYSSKHMNCSAVCNIYTISTLYMYTLKW